MSQAIGDFLWEDQSHASCSGERGKAMKQKGHIPRKKVLNAAKVMEKKGMNAWKRLQKSITQLSHVKLFSPGEWEETEQLEEKTRRGLGRS